MKKYNYRESLCNDIRACFDSKRGMTADTLRKVAAFATEQAERLA